MEGTSSFSVLNRHTNNLVSSLLPCSPTLLQQVVCLSVDGLRQSFGVAMSVHANWWVEYSGHSKPHSTHRAAVSTFSFADRHIFGITPITEVLHSSQQYCILSIIYCFFTKNLIFSVSHQSTTIINTAILTNQPVSLPVIVLAISQDGKVSDVTSAVTCYSTNENTVKVCFGLM